MHLGIEACSFRRTYKNFRSSKKVTCLKLGKDPYKTALAERALTQEQKQKRKEWGNT